MKQCGVCHEVKPFSHFGVNRQRKDGLQAECRPCRRAASRARYAADKAAQGEGQRWRSVKSLYGLTRDGWMALFDAQNGQCAICPRMLIIPQGGRRDKDRTVIDHDHETGQVRGLLCGHCNLGIGYLADHPDRLRAAADYLEQHRQRQEPPQAPARPGHVSGPTSR